MNEENNISARHEDTAPETDSTSAMEDDWDDIDLSDIVDDENDGAEQEEPPVETETDTPEADQQTEEPGQEQQEETPKADTEPAEEPAEQTFDLKFLGETKTVNRDEVITLAQKGLNYDKVLAERDTTKSELEQLGGISLLRDCKEFLEELAAESRMTVSDLMDSTRAEVLAKKEGLDNSVALQRIKLDRDRKAFEAEKARKEAERKAKNEAEEKQNRDILSFVQAYPEVQPQDIPKEVWDSVHRDGISLTAAYSAFENKKLREEVKAWKSKAETAEQNYKNQQRSTGSQSTAGVGTATKKDPIDLDWYSGD